MLKRDEWLDLARKLDWTFRYVTEEEVFPEELSGAPWLPHEAWKDWDEPYKDSYREYVQNQLEKDQSILAVRDAVGRMDDIKKLDPSWVQMVKFHHAPISLGEYAAATGELRMARFGRDSAWRTMASLGALDEMRHTQIPLLLAHQLVRIDPGFDWAHKCLHTNQWASIAARHFFDDQFTAANAIDTALQLTFVFETGYTNLEFVALTAMADKAEDSVFEKALTSIQTDESRHAQIGGPTLEVILKHDPERAQYLLDKQFWRCWRIILVLTGCGMDYLTPLDARPQSYKEFMQEWIVDQYIRQCEEFGLKLPWYWDTFLEELDCAHHSFMLGLYTYRSTMWLDYAMPSPDDKKWLREKYPDTWERYYEPIWDHIAAAWRDKGEHATLPYTLPSLCNLCQLPTAFIRPGKNTACTLDYNGRKYIFCSEPCRWIFQQEPIKFASHKNVIDRVFAGEAPTDLQGAIKWFEITPDVMGRDLYQGEYPWLNGTNGKGAKVASAD